MNKPDSGDNKPRKRILGFNSLGCIDIIVDGPSEKPPFKPLPPHVREVLRARREQYRQLMKERQEKGITEPPGVTNIYID